MAENRDHEKSYEVGHGKPPKGTQFKKGQSGNPKGRPKGSQNTATIFNKVGRQFITVVENGRKRKLTKLEAIVLQIHAKAMADKNRGVNDYLNAYKVFVAADLAEEGAASTLPERHSPVFAAIVQRIRESGNSEQTTTTEEPKTNPEEDEPKEEDQ